MNINISRRNAAKSFLAVAAGGMIPSLKGEAVTTGAKGYDETIRTQVCVIGGGSGGTGAALAAARAGVDVVLLERDSILGGTATSSFVNVWRPVTGGDGIPRELFMAMARDPSALTLPANCDLNSYYIKSQLGPRNIAGKNVKRGVGVTFEPRAMDYTVRSLLDATGRCKILFSTTFYRAHLKDNKIVSIEAWFKGKRILIQASVFIDCTADGDVCADAGCAYHMGEDPKSRYNEPHAPEKARMLLNGLTLCYRITDTGVKQKPYLPEEIKENSCSLSACYDRMPNGDIVAIADHHIDIHGSGHFKCPFPKAPFGIPLRCLQPKGVENLMIACRAAGFSHIASGAARLQRTLITLGQAAGNAAAMAVEKNVRVDQVDVKELQARLVKQNVTITA
ncbi:MAG: FAD-dependent oxidoreductase [Kiritimatiellae bacterium]|jgi:hypothetical protein|nr:FAD-dependent oxidoreductase [Kiritimatiellia bacterium]